MVQRITISQHQYQAQNGGQEADAIIQLQTPQVHYLMRVLRLNVGDRFIAQNGQGQQWLVEITPTTNEAQVVKTLTPRSVQPESAIRLIAALPKGNRFDEVVRQTTELGVTHIHPVIAQRTLLKPSDNKLARWRRIAQEASEQSERITVPEIFEPVSFQQCIQHPIWEGEHARADAKETFQNLSSELRYICAARANNQSLKEGSVKEGSGREGSVPTVHLLADLLTHQSANLASATLPSIVLAIGPEGGWTPDEITVAINNSYKVASLGSVILRAVTAPVTALSLVASVRDLLI